MGRRRMRRIRVRGGVRAPLELVVARVRIILNPILLPPVARLLVDDVQLADERLHAGGDVRTVKAIESINC
tara:strand:+ start:312 stop:524 length:213 start_codon:yes stop_codon:yes gene_type:complete